MSINNELTTLSGKYISLDKPEDRENEFVYTLAGKAVKLSDDETEVNPSPCRPAMGGLHSVNLANLMEHKEKEGKTNERT